MPVCQRCGKSFSGFSFGSSIATECKDCRKAQSHATTTDKSVAADTAVATAASFTPYVTFTLIALNGLVYLVMGLWGVSWTDPSIEHAVRWGADFGPLTLTGDWWRSLTSTFVHFGIIHIGLNMWCLLDLGSSLERFMGRKAFGVTYVLCGLFGSLASTWWNPWRVSAGASGAIFGIAGAFVSYLYFKKAPVEQMQVKKKLKSLLIFIGYNLLYGTAGNVDNSAHIGGLIAGLILGGLAPQIRASGAAENAVAGTSAPSVSSAEFPPVSAQGKADADRVMLQLALCGLLVLLGGAIWVHRRDSAVVHYGRAIRLVRTGQLTEAAREMERAATVDPSLYFPAEYLGELRLEQADPAAAVPVLEHTLTIVSSYNVSHNLALAYLGTGRPKDALKQINDAIPFEKTDPWRGQYILALAAQQSGDSQLAAQTLRIVVQTKPEFGEARETLTSLGSSAPGTSAAAIPYSRLAFKSEYWPLYP